MSRKHTIEASFTRRARSYDAHCQIQSQVSQKLSEFLPELSAPRVLELGCGTGVFTRRLVDRYRDGQFMISDFSQEMIASCAVSMEDNPALSFQVIDADKLALDQRFDVIASSLAFHWFDDPRASLLRQRKHLKPGGLALYSTIGIENFPEWRAVLSELGLDSGVCPGPVLPGLVLEERVSIDYGDALGFMTALKKTGASVSKAGYRPLGSRDLKRACQLFDERFAGKVTWHIVYGMLEALAPIRQLRSLETSSVRG